MPAEVVEVTARIADSVVALEHVGPGASFRIGSAPGVDLPIAHGALRSFPLLDRGFVFRRPAGIDALLHVDGEPVPLTETELPLRRGYRIELALGHVTISLAVLAAPRTPVPRPRAEVRPWIYGAVVLIAHLIVWGAAMFLEPIERLGVEVELVQPTHVRIPHDEPPPPKPKPPEQKSTEQKAASASQAAPPVQAARDDGPRDPKARAIAGARKQGMFGALSDLSGLVPTVDVRKLVEESVFYDEEAATKNQFGNSRRFDPRNKAGWGTVATGRYATVSTGHGAGDDFELEGGIRHPQPNIDACTPKGCHIDGPLEQKVVRHEVDLRIGAFGYCYQQHAIKQLRGTVILDFAIGIDGAVHGASAKGMDEIKSCLVEVVNVIPFPAQEAETNVRYPLSFRPS